MKCEKCGTELVKNGTYCVRCGTMVKSEQERLINLAKSELAGKDSSQYSNLTHQHTENTVNNTPAMTQPAQQVVQPEPQMQPQPQVVQPQVVNPQPIPQPQVTQQQAISPQVVPQQVASPQVQAQPQVAPQQVLQPTPQPIPVPIPNTQVQPAQPVVQPEPQMQPQPQVSVQPQVMAQPVNNQVNTTPNVNPQVTNTIPVQPTNTGANNTINDEELLKAYIGKNYDKITKKPFNFAGFFFTAYYMFYRKMFVYGIIVILINACILSIINNMFINLAICLALGFTVNKLYVDYAKKEINKIKMTNPQMSTMELAYICSQKGRTNTANIFLGIAINFAISAVISFILGFMGIAPANGWQITINGKDLNTFIEENKEKDEDNSSYNDDSNSNNNEDESDDDNEKYEGMLSTDSSVIILDEFSITIPSIFEEGMFNDEDQLEYEYEGEDGVFNECSISLSAVNGYSSAENLINQMQKYNEDDDASEVEKTKVNGITWHWFNYEDAFGKKYIYGTTKDNKVYLFEYEIQEDADSSCSSYRKEVLNSIKKK